MEETVTKEPEVKRPEPTLPPAPVRAAAPVMDVHRPTAVQHAPPTAAPLSSTDKSPEVHEAPEEDGDSDDAPTPPQPAVQQPKVKKPAKPHQPGVGGAIAATVIIVLGLAALAVYAYLKSNQ